MGKVRSIDIMNELNFSKPSVSIAVKQLRENGYIEIDEGGYITLTLKGLKIAECIYERHILLTKWLIGIGVSEATAKKDACLLEHDMSHETFEKLKAFWEQHYKIK